MTKTRRCRRPADPLTLPLLVLIVLGLLATLVGATKARAQGSWVRTGEGARSFALEVQKPSFEADEFTFLTTVLVLSGEFPVSDGISAELELPFAHAGFDAPFASSSSSRTFGNPYVGAAFYRDDGSGSLRVGVRLPLAREFGDDDFATGVGVLSDQDRMERFPPDVLSLLGLGEHRSTLETGLTWALHGGGSVMTPTSGRGETEGYLLYGAGIEAPFQAVRLGAGLTGRMIVTESELGLGERTIHQVSFSGRLDRGRVRPAVQYRLPVDDDLGQVLDWVLSLGVEIRAP